MESYFKNKNLFNLITRWKYHLIIIMVVAGALAVLFSSSYFIKPKYESKAVLYPFNTITLSEESETEQMLEVLQSSDIRFKIYETFDIAEHYGIPSDDAEYLAKLNNSFDKNIGFSKTPNEAIEIEFMDTDPQMASDVVDSIIAFYNQKQLQLNKIKSKEQVRIYNGRVSNKMTEVDSLISVLKKHRKENDLLHYGIQVEQYTEAIINGRCLNEARKNLGNWKEFGGEYLKTDSLLWNAMEDHHDLKITLETYLMDASKEITYAHVVAEPFPAGEKAYPVRWIIILFSVLGAFIAGLFILILIDKAKITRSA
ncbi:MAG: hypothetical protein PF590_02765 [Candidatus Delongbacteria bacterium]|jgi:uncharacterized protein involved in exopolysaccharide biosynthesis|nr:hypothetical protein [Candidatus Delongbacteria bacterium]